MAPNKTSNRKENAPPSITPIKTSKCKSLTGKSTITYQIGHNEKRELLLRISGNSGGGYFGKDWVSIEDLFTELRQSPEQITSSTVAKLFHRRSANNAGFTLAAILNEGVVAPSQERRRCFVLQDTQPFISAMENPDDKPTARKKRSPSKKKTVATADDQ